MKEEGQSLLRRYIELIVRFRWLVVIVMLAVSAGLLTQAKNLEVIIDPNNIVPQSHPYVAVTMKVEEVFGSRYVAVIGVTAKEGDIFQPNVLGKIQRITRKLRETPRVVKSNLLSIAARRAKDISGSEEGMSVQQLMPTVPETPQEMAALKAALERNNAYLDSTVSRDWRTTAVVVELREGKGGFRSVMQKINEIVDAERDDTVEIAVGGAPVFLANIEKYASRIAFLFPLAVLIVGLIHFEAFRTFQGLILPLVTPLLAVMWALGIMGLANVPLDIFNTTTPILILAVGAGHAVQLLKRYYEEYNRLRGDPSLTPRQANRQAVIESVSRIGPVMLTAGGVAAIGFFSLMVFDIISIRVFGVFTGMGILSVLILEMTFIPALRSILPAPGEKEARREREEHVWDRLTGFYANLVLGPNRNRIFIVALVLVAVALAGMSRLKVESSLKNYFSADLPIRMADAELNERLAGTNSIFVLVDAQEPDAIKDPALLSAMDQLQAYLAEQPHVGKTLSIADFIKRMNQAMHQDDPAYYTIPENRNTIAEYLFLYSISGEPGDFDPYVDYDYQLANLVIYLKSDSTRYTEEIAARITTFADTHFPPGVKVGIGGSVPQGAAVTEVIVKDKILNVIQIGCVVLLIASLVFRSFLAGVLVVTPLLLAVLFNMGLMGVTGMTLNVPSALISALAIGIGADYAIYMLFRLREELSKTDDEDQAFRTVFRTAGKACLFVASAVAGGYAVQAFSRGYNPHTWSAMLIGSAMIVSATAALTVMPALVRKFRPKFIFNEASMKRASKLFIATSVLGTTLLLGALPQPAHALSAAEIMDRNVIVTRVKDAEVKSTITLTNRAGKQRVRETSGTTKLKQNGIDNMRMTRFESPSDIRGTVTLLIENSDEDDDIWIYLPSLKKVRRLVSSNKKDSFVGTDFSYGDVIGHKVRDWTHTLLREEEVDGQPCYVIESMPVNKKVRSDSGYSKRVSWIRKDVFVIVKGLVYDEADELLKEFRFTDYVEIDPENGRWFAGNLEAKNTQTEHHTKIHIDEYEINVGVKDSYFTTRYMKRR